jgi:MoaA/NifB/PqqE/SkfB family radical SAM enzyme
MISLLPHLFSPDKRCRVPPYLTHFITRRCNAHCPHCFIFKPDDPRFSGRELDLAEIEEVTRKIGRGLFSVNITGGEIFLRDDVLDICEIYLQNTSVRVIQLFTNGSFEEKTVRGIEALSGAHEQRTFVVSISIDEIGDRHDRLRRLDGAFASAMRTHDRLRALGRSNICLDIGLTVSRANQARLDLIYDELVLRRGVRGLSCTLVRGEPLDPETKEVDLEAYRRFARRIDEGRRRGELDCFRGFPGADLLNAKNVVMRRLVEETAALGYRIPCFAGRLAGVIYPAGDVHPCEILPASFGNLRANDYDLATVWNSSKADEIRARIWKDHCHCTHECAMTVNVAFNPRLLPDLLWEYARIKLGQ